MKIISLLAVLVSLATAILLPLQLEIAGSMLFATGLVLLMVQDYSARRTLRFDTARAATGQLTAREVFRRRTAASAVFRAPALSSEQHRLAA